MYPEADLHALMDFYDSFDRQLYLKRSVRTSFLQHMPFARQMYRYYLPLMPIAIEQLDLTSYEVVISSSHAVAKGILVRPDQLHISYVHSPPRYAWDLQRDYLNVVGTLQRLISLPILHYMRMWDVATTARVDVLVANSTNIAKRIWRIYRRRAHVIHPPVEVDRFNPKQTREDFYLTVSRVVPYKRVDLIVEAFSRLGLPLVVIGDGPGGIRLREKCARNVQFLGRQPDSVVKDYMERCKAFVFAAEEDFGITPVEAQAAGAPVIAYGRGGVLDTVIPGTTGFFFGTQTVEALTSAVTSFEANECKIDPEVIRKNAERFRPEAFTRQFGCLLESVWNKFKVGLQNT
jgi:glycosyltransferase involved in cell wall biosynthesis